MGHGASTPLPAPDHYQKRFREVERKCSSGYYNNSLAEYREALKTAILYDSLDFLEILLAGGPAKSVYPLHLASATGKLEAVELMLTAGFPAFAKDAQGNTPLHCTVQCVDDPDAAAVCATALCIQIPQLHKVYNKDGLTVLHAAAQADHVAVFSAVLQCGGDVKQKTMQGETIREICVAWKAQRILQLLDKRHDSKPSHGKAQKSNAAKANTYIPEPPRSGAEMDRVLAVWDRFFENAFALHEARLAAYPQPPASTQKNKAGHSGSGRREEKQSQGSGKKGVQTHKDYKNDDPSPYLVKTTRDLAHKAHDAYYYEEDWKDEKPGDTENMEDAGTYAEVLDWLSYVLHAPQGDEGAALLVVDTRDSCVYSVHEFAEYVEQNYVFLPYSSAEFLPTNLLQCVQQRYVTYFDAAQNLCSWCNLYTHHTLSTLPLGYDAYWQHAYSDSTLLPALGLLSYDDTDFYTSQQAAQSWVMVLLEEDEEDRRRKPKGAQEVQMHYFYNTLSHQTTWQEPPGFGDENASWRLCCMESNPSAYFYYHAATGESVWA